jgi:HK97 family phage portal protein
MANLFQRVVEAITNGDSSETRSARTAPTRPAASYVTEVTADTAISLTPVYRAIQVIATPIAKMDIKTFRYAGGTEEQIENPLFVNKPSLIDTRRELLFQTVTSLALTGEAFWLKTYNSNGTSINSIRLIPSRAVTVREDLFGQKLYDYYITNTYPINQDLITATAKEMEHIKLFSIPGILRGVGPIQTCKDDIAGALDLRKYASTWFQNSGVPTGLLKTNQMITADQADEVTARWHEKQANRQLAVVGNGFDYDPIALSPKDALFTEVQSQMVQSIARLFGVPARLLLTGVDGSSDTYSNLTEENQVFYRHTLMAYLDVIEDAMTNCLPRGTRVKFDYEGLFKADLKARYDAYAVAVAGGWMTPEEVRVKEGI